MASMDFRVRVPFRGVDIERGKALITIPNGAVINMADAQVTNALVTVRWGERELLVFERDLFERAIKEPPKAASNGPRVCAD